MNYGLMWHGGQVSDGYVMDHGLAWHGGAGVRGVCHGLTALSDC